MPEYNYYNQELTANNFLEMVSTATGKDQPSTWANVGTTSKIPG